MIKVCEADANGDFGIRPNGRRLKIDSLVETKHAFLNEVALTSCELVKVTIRVQQTRVDLVFNFSRQLHEFEKADAFPLHLLHSVWRLLSAFFELVYVPHDPRNYWEDSSGFYEKGMQVELRCFLQ